MEFKWGVCTGRYVHLIFLCIILHMPQKHKIESPEALLKYWNEYVKWATDNPLIELDAVYNAREDKWVDRRKLRPLTEQGFGAWLGGKGQTKNVKDYLRNHDGYYNDYVEVAKYIKDSISAFLLEHSTVKTFEPGTVARILGIATQEAKEGESNSIKPLEIRIIKNNDNKPT